uniref:arginine decarboxylase n=1 Tax=viral metagenome TaxID=1070528 RepID=A0A6C0F3I2_9ZZZZ
MIILGNRVPYEYFITKGRGESNAGSEGLPYETGSYDAALFEAGIQNANIIEYTSVMPTGSKQISKEEGLKRLQWGEVLECIKAQSNGKKGSKISAAVITTSVIDPKGKYLGGFAVEYAGSGTKQDAEASLAESITGIIERRGYGKAKGGRNLELYKDNVTDNGYKIHPGEIFEYDNLDVTKEHGSVFAAICFVSYKIPTFKKSKSNSNSRRMKRRRTKSKSSKSKK